MRAFALIMSVFCANSAIAETQLTASAVDFPWPLTVAEASVDCRRGMQAVVVTDQGVFALNGVAQRDFPQVDPVWKDNPDIPGTKVNIGPLIELALKEC